MVLAVDQLDAPIARLGDGEVAVGIARRTVVVGDPFLWTDDEATVGPGFTFVVGNRRIEPRRCEVTARALESHALVLLPWHPSLVGEGTEHDGAFLEPQHGGALRVAHDRKLTDLPMPRFAEIAGVAGGHLEVEELLLGIFGRQAAKGHEASVGEFDDGRMDARDARAAVAGANAVVASEIATTRLPGAAIVAADDERGSVIGHRDHAVLGADGISCRLSVCPQHLGLAPGDAVIGGAAHEIVAMLTGFDEMIDRLVAIPPDLRRVIIHVLRIPEWRGRFPLHGTEAQSRAGVGRGEIGFAHGGEPHGEQIAIRALGDGRAVILADEHRADRAIGNANEGLRAFNERRLRWLRCDSRHGLAHVLRVYRRRGQRQKFSLRKLTLHHAEADAFACGIRHPRAAIRRAQEADH